MWISGINGICIEENVYFSNFEFVSNGISFIFENEKGTIRYIIKFNELVFSYRFTHGSYYLHLVDEVIKGHTVKFFERNSVFTSSESDYINWFRTQNFEMVFSKPIMHFLIIEEDFVFEILNDEYPEIIIENITHK